MRIGYRVLTYTRLAEKGRLLLAACVSLMKRLPAGAFRWRCGVTCADRCAAAAAGDIGKLFPDTDPALRERIRELLREARRRIQAKAHPRQRRCHHYCAGAENAAAYSGKCVSLSPKILGCHMDEVNVKATTTESTGFNIDAERRALLAKRSRRADEGGEMTEFDTTGCVGNRW